MVTSEEISETMYGPVWDLLYDITPNEERARIRGWISDFLEKSPYSGEPVDKYFRQASTYFGYFIENRKRGTLSMGIEKIVDSLDPVNVEQEPGSVGNKINGIIKRLEKRTDK